MPIVLVTDSTAELAPERVAELGVTVVPLLVVIGDECFEEGAPEATPEAIAAALRDKRPVTTSRAAPAVFAETYRRLAAEGATGILSLHVSGEVSGTVESATLGARDAGVEVRCLDTRQIGPATGFALEAAAAVLAAGGRLDEAEEAARRRADATTTLLYVDSLEYLRRGGRVGGAAAVVGGVLAVKPLLTIRDGEVVPVAKVRTAARAISRMEALAVEAAGDGPVEVVVAHLDAEERAGELAERIAERLGDRLVAPVRCRELGAVLGAHVGPGMLAVCIAPVIG
ncbi:DegV family protein [Nocardioides sp. GY 10113]|uniref:DegV family protein n=1 Tax=Nocardioides sp. GY 10113 TaxID=2569761 RepID=UPI0010A750BD|nr:DegV family protein [Nocardioides sp. GY 10113]TIC84866.1 DegV family protein [Nocardioides sp. GY 10113]